MSNVVAAEAEIEIDVRFSRMTEAQRISELMRNLEPFDKRIRLTVAGGVNRGPLERTEGVVRLYQHAREVAGCLGFELRAFGRGSLGRKFRGSTWCSSPRWSWPGWGWRARRT